MFFELDPLYGVQSTGGYALIFLSYANCNPSNVDPIAYDYVSHVEFLASFIIRQKLN